MMNLSGHWRGEIYYGYGYEDLPEGSELIFEMTLVQEGNLISGTAVDVEGVGFNKIEAEIIGKIHNGQVSFGKRYKEAVYIGSLPQLNSSNSPWIYYVGEYDESTQCLNGSWRYKNEYDESGTQLLSKAASGTWKAWRDD
jgi:hypothetical protein